MSDNTNNVEALRPGVGWSSPGPVPKVIALLESLLERAKRGEIRGVAISSINRAGDNLSNYVSDIGLNESLLLVGVVMLQARMIADRRASCTYIEFPGEDSDEDSDNGGKEPA